MRLTAFPPSRRLAPYVRSLTVVEASVETTRTLIPDTGIVLGLRYSGCAWQVDASRATLLPNASLTGLRATARRVRTSAGGGVVLATFREGGAQHFLSAPLNELFGRTVALDEVVPHRDIEDVGSRITSATEGAERVAIVEQFLLARFEAQREDFIVTAALGAIHAARGSIRVGGLAGELGIGQDRLEKRFRRAVGASPKEFASILRLRLAVDSYRAGTTLTQLATDAGFFDQSHFIREFRSVTGEAPQRFFRADEHC